MKLIKAYHFMQDMMDGDYPVWISESPRVRFETKRKISKPREAVDRANQQESDRLSKLKNGKPTPGLYFAVEPKVTDGGPMPTFEEWLQSRKNVADGKAHQAPDYIRKSKFGSYTVEDHFVPGSSENFTRGDDEVVD